MSQLGYPENILEFAAVFHSDDICLDYLVKSRWPDGFVCPGCGHRGGWWIKSCRRFQCTGCRRQVSPLSNTLMHRSHLPIRTWFWAAYLVSTHTPGMSAVQLQRQLGIGQVRSAWFLLHRLRLAMVKGKRKPLEGVVEWGLHEVGSPLRGVRRDGVIKAPKRTTIVGAVEVVKNEKGKEMVGKLRLQIVSSPRSDDIKNFLSMNVAAGSDLRCAPQSVYSGSARAGACPEDGQHVHRVFENMREWLNGIHHGVSSKYLQAYLDEFVFRFNRRDRPMAAFRCLLGVLTEKPPMKSHRLTALAQTQKPKNNRARGET